MFMPVCKTSTGKFAGGTQSWCERYYVSDIGFGFAGSL